MASENKKRKAKNSYIHNGADKKDCKMKHYIYISQNGIELERRKKLGKEK